MTSAEFVFHHEWRVDAPVAVVFSVLADPLGYPQWWPQVRSATSPSSDVCLARVRSLLPVTLRLRLIRDVEDPVVAALRVRLDGDLRGWCGWRMQPDGRGGCVGVFDQEVDVVSPALRLGARVGRPVLVANHAWMMRSGERGLQRHLHLESHPQTPTQSK